MHKPRQRHRSVRALRGDSDSVMSDISSHSSYTSIWTNNPIAKHLREVEAKTQYRKTREIEQSRERAAMRLKPKGLDEDSKTRLEQLRVARENRASKDTTATTTTTTSTSTSQQNNRLANYKMKANRALEYFLKDWDTMWTKHDSTTRMIVMSVLVSSLFSLLFMETVFESYMARHYQAFWIGIWQNIVSIVYMFFAAFVHFMMCYVSLMYAFSALQIGSIAGKQAQRFYSKNIHLVVGISSTSMVLLGILKATAATISRWIVWKMVLLWGLLGRIFVSMTNWTPPSTNAPSVVQTLRNFVGSVSCGIVTAISSGCTGILDTVMMVLRTLDDFLIQSNALGRIVSALLMTLLKPFFVPVNILSSYVQFAIDSYEGRIPSRTWREDAYESTRFLLSYSGFFLLVVLLLFNLLAKEARSGDVEVTPEVDDVEPVKEWVNSNPQEPASGDVQPSTSARSLPSTPKQLSSPDTLPKATSRTNENSIARSGSSMSSRIQTKRELPNTHQTTPRVKGTTRSGEQKQVEKIKRFRLLRNENRNKSKVTKKRTMEAQSTGTVSSL